ncbi:MAG: hypothetical protein JJ953_02470 [Gracilimonas sp.]|uniref:DUF6090 family protein n=1 Tax=Gracilimonas TaxID=649462 RepID=UPI001B25C71D|nr:DUF6090 family protein [Gracilimonas sp.]MBO6584950.1 hypothetical protein [Gracilimonas sp.]MBO6615779.1 hypothetical protein [Gracilimonas sp.]
MLHYFRQIRQKLILQEKARKYLLYAMGEIILVVIGILIALQINNWNQDRINRANEEFYLVNLINDINLQIDELNSTIQAEDTVALKLRAVGDLLKEGLTPEDMPTLNLNLSYLLANRSVNIFDATFEDLKSTGNLKLIDDEHLRQKLTAFYQSMERADRVLLKNEGFKNQIREEMIRYSLVNFNLDYDIGLTTFLKTSGIPVYNPIQDIKNQNKFDRIAMENIFSDDGIMRLNNLLTSRYLSSLVSVATLKVVRNQAEELIIDIRINLGD